MNVKAFFKLNKIFIHLLFYLNFSKQSHFDYKKKKRKKIATFIGIFNFMILSELESVIFII